MRVVALGCKLGHILVGLDFRPMFAYDYVSS
jgi:hypothetical protein